jgi:hypothetical protein
VVWAWRSAELYGGGGTQGISFDPKGTRVIIGGDNNGVKVSFDSGINWRAALGGYPDQADALQTVAVLWSRDPNTPDRCWTGNKNGFAVSNNSGQDWKYIPQWNGNFTHNGPTNDRPRVDGHCIDDDGVGNLYMGDANGRVYRYHAFDAQGLNGTFGTSGTPTIAALGETITSVYLDPSNNQILYVTTREGGVYQLENIRNASAVVRSFTGTGSLASAEELVPVNEGTAGSPDIRLYVVGAATSGTGGAVRRGTRGTPGGTTNIGSTWDDITPPLGAGWSAIDAVRPAGSTLVAVGCSVNPKTSNGCVEMYYSANGHAATPTWRLLTGDDANSDFVNAMGGPGGKPWWGYGLRAGAKTGEMSPNRWITGNGGVEGCAFDPANPNRIIGVGQNMAFIFDVSTKKAYPSVVGLMSGVETMPIIDPLDDDHIMVTNNDHIQHTTKTGGYGGDWRKNQNGCSPGGETAMFLAAFVGGHQYAGFGSRFDNLNGKVYFHLDATNGDNWTDTGFAASGKRPMGLAGRRISGNDVIVIAVQNSGIWKRTFTSPGAGGSWSLQDTGPFSSMGAGKRQRPFPIYWASDTILYCYDPTSGIWRSNNAGASWNKIWAVICDSEREGYITVPPDDPTTIYASFGKSATTANEGVWRLDGANSGSVDGSSGLAQTINKVQLKRPNGTAFIDPGTIACASGGRLGVTEFGTVPDPSAYLSQDGGNTFVDVTDNYFRRAARKVFGSAMAENGRWFVTSNGPGMYVYDQATSVGGNGTGGGDPGGGDPGGGQPAVIGRTLLLGFSTAQDGGVSPNPYVTSATAATGGANRLLVMHVFNSGDTAAGLPSSIAGLGVTWTLRETEVFTASDLTQRRVSTYTAITTAAGVTGPITVTFGATQSGLEVQVIEYSNVDVGSGGSPMTVGITHKAVNSVGTGDTTNQTAYTSQSFTPAAGSLICVLVSGVDNGGQGPVGATVTDNAGRTYTLRGSVTATSTDDYGLFLYTAPAGGSPAATTVTVTFTQAIIGCDMEVFELANADTTTPLGQAVVTGTALTSSAPTFSLGAAPAATSMVVAASIIRRNPPAWTDEAGWTAFTEITHGTPANGMHVAARNGDQAWGGTGTNGTIVAWLIVEFKGTGGGIGDPVLQTNSAQWDGISGSKPTVALANPLRDAASAVEYASVTPRFPAAWDPEVGWLEDQEAGYTAPPTGGHVAYALAHGDNSFAAAAGTNGRWGATIMEIGAAAGGGVVGGITVTADFDFIAGTFKEVSADFDFMPMTVALNTLTSGASDTDAASYDTASISPTSGRTVYAAVESAKSDGTSPDIPTVAPGFAAGLTWTTVTSVVYDDGLTTQRRRLTILEGTGTPSAGVVRFAFATTQTHANWVLVESNGALAQFVTATAQNAVSVTNSITPEAANTTIVSFASKKAAGTITPDAVSQTLAAVSNAAPNGASIGMATGLSSPATLTVGVPTPTDLVLISLELVPASVGAVSASFDFYASGVTVVTPGKKHKRTSRLSRVFASVGDTEIRLHDDWEFSETAMGGYDMASLSLPEWYARRHPHIIDEDAEVVFWNDAGQELWRGVVQRPPEFSDGLAHLEAAGAQHIARDRSDRLLYQVVGTDGWVICDSDPHNYQANSKFDASVDNNRLLVNRQKGETFQSGQKSGFVFWADGEDLNRLAFILRKTASLTNYEVRVQQADGPSGDLVTVRTYPLDDNNPDHTPKNTTNLGGHHDLIAMMVYCNSDNTPGSNEKIWFEDIRVNGIADDDTFTTAQVARDIAHRLGWDTDAIVASDFNALPYEVNDQDWGSALDYLSLLDKMPWQAYGETMRRKSWDADEYDLAYEEGVTADLSPEPVYDTVTIKYQSNNDKWHEVTETQGPGRTYPPVTMSDPQRGPENARQYAENLLQEKGVERWGGTVTVTDGEREMHAGRTFVLHDWDQEDDKRLKISDVTQHADSVELGIESPQIVSRWLARYAQRQARRGHAVSV